VLLEKFHAKRKHRNERWKTGQKSVRYHVRKNLADSRVRIKGRFVTGKHADEPTRNGQPVPVPTPARVQAESQIPIAAAAVTAVSVPAGTGTSARAGGGTEGAAILQSLAATNWCNPALWQLVGHQSTA
jgi:hypothetical protein